MHISVIPLTTLPLLCGCSYYGMDKQQLQMENVRLQNEAEANAKARSKQPGSQELAMALPAFAAKAAPPSPPPGPFDAQKHTCRELGFKIGTKDFGNCVMELMD